MFVLDSCFVGSVSAITEAATRRWVGDGWDGGAVESGGGVRERVSATMGAADSGTCVRRICMVAVAASQL